MTDTLYKDDVKEKDLKDFNNICDECKNEDHIRPKPKNSEDNDPDTYQN